MTLKNKYKVSAYLTDSEVELLDLLATQWECSKSQAIIRAIRVLTNSDNNPNPISNPIPPHSVNVGLSKEDIELLIEQKIELLVNPKLELLGEHNEKKLSDLTTEIETIKAVLEALSLDKKRESRVKFVQKMSSDATEAPQREGGLMATELARKIAEEHSVKCDPSYISLYLKNDPRLPARVKTILDDGWKKVGALWYPI